MPRETKGGGMEGIATWPRSVGRGGYGDLDRAAGSR